MIAGVWAWVLGGAWAGLAATVVAPAPSGLTARRRAAALAPSRRGPARAARIRAHRTRGVRGATAVLRRLGVVEPTEAAAIWAMAAAVAVPAGLLQFPLATLVALVAIVAVVRVRAAAGRRRAGDRLAENVPDVVDLLRLAVGAGLTPALAVPTVGRRAAGPVAEALTWASTEAALGRRLADALDDVPARFGPHADVVRPLTSALAASERYGAALGPTLERLADEVRAGRRRRAEERARRVPVLLLFPLVTCILPAFALLTVAPLVAGALQSLRP